MLATSPSTSVSMQMFQSDSIVDDEVYLIYNSLTTNFEFLPDHRWPDRKMQQETEEKTTQFRVAASLDSRPSCSICRKPRGYLPLSCI